MMLDAIKNRWTYLSPFLLAGVFLTSGCDAGQFVTDPGVEEWGIDLTEATLNALGDTLVLTVKGADGSLEWSSSNPDIASVDSAGNIISLAVGAVMISASACPGSSCWKDSAKVKVRQVPASVSVSPSHAFMNVGESVRLKAAAIDSNGQAIRPATFDWATSAANLVDVDKNGQVSALADGYATVTATVEGVKGTAGVTVGDTSNAGVPAAPGSGPAELPRARVSTAYVAPTGNTVRVAAGGDLQAALDAARPGDRILLEAGATYTGNFVLPAKSGTGWITVATETTLPGEGTRVTPTAAGSFARIVTPGYSPALRTADGASHYRIMGVEVAAAAAVTETFALVRLGSGTEADPAALANNLILDRVYVHGHDNLELRRCVEMNAASAGLVDSYLQGCHAAGFDSQAVVAWNTPGPLRIANNYLEGAGENVMFGGADPAAEAMIPADIEFVGNDVIKPAAWHQSGRWSIKNLFEIKTATRVLIEGNIFDGSWNDAQGGSALLIKSVNQSGGTNGAFSYSSDITIRYNLIRNAESGLSLAARPNDWAAQPLSRVLIEHNLLEQLGFESAYGSDSKATAFSFLDDIRDLVVRNNTALGRFSNQIGFAGAGKTGFVFENNVVDRSEYGWSGASTLDDLAPGHVIVNNVIAPATWNDYLPAGNCITEPVMPVPAACAGAGVDEGALAQVLGR